MRSERSGSTARVALLFATLAFFSCSSDNDDDDASPPDDAPGTETGADDFDVTFAPLDCLELTSAEALEELPLGDPAVTCGRVRVPADWATPDGDTIDLAVYRIAATTDTPAPDPVVLLAGGPGQAAVTFLNALDSGIVFLRERAEVIVVDQRGTGFSTPSLLCPDYTAIDEGDDDIAEFATSAEAIAAAQEALAACVDRLVGENVSIADYTTANNARDIDAVRRALGFESWNVIGGSYGTTLALTLLRDRPEGVRSVVLDSVAPLQVSLLTPAEVLYANLYWPLSRIVTNCASDADCSANLGDIRDPIEDGIARLAAAPVGPLTAPAYVNLLAELVGEPDLPSVVQTIASGSDADVMFLAEAFGGDEEGNPPVSATPEGLLPLFDSGVMYAGVICAEEVPYAYAESLTGADLPDDFRQSTRDIVEAEAELAYDAEFCTRLGVPAADPIDSRAVSSDVPALVLAGDTDVQTPPAWSELAAETLSRSQYVELPGAGHVAVADGFPCTAELVVDFLDDPEAPVDRSCVDALPLVDYVVVTEPAAP